MMKLDCLRSNLKRLAASVSLTLLLVNPVVAAHSDGAPRDEGRARSILVHDPFDGWQYSSTESLVTSVHSFYEDGLGVEHVRVWARSPQVRTFYENNMKDGWTAILKVQPTRADLHAKMTDPRKNGFTPFFTTVPRTDAREHQLSPLVHDILNYLMLPGNTIEAIANGFHASVYVWDQNPHHYTVTIQNSIELDACTVELPNSVPWYNADGGVDGIPSSAEAFLHYRLPKTYSNFQLRGEGQMAYRVWYRLENGLFGYFTAWSGAAGVTHTVN